MMGLRLIENTILPWIRNPFDLLSMAHTCRDLRKFVRSMNYWKCPHNEYCEDKCGFDEFVYVLRFLSGLESESNDYNSNCISYLIRFVIYPYRFTGFEYGRDKPHQFGDMVFPCITWFRPITEFHYIQYDWGRDYNSNGEYAYGIQEVCTELIMKRICFYYYGDLEYAYNNNILCNWIRTPNRHYPGSYIMIPDKIFYKKIKITHDTTPPDKIYHKK